MSKHNSQTKFFHDHPVKNHYKQQSNKKIYDKL